MTELDKLTHECRSVAVGSNTEARRRQDELGRLLDLMRVQEAAAARLRDVAELSEIPVAAVAAAAAVEAAEFRHEADANADRPQPQAIEKAEQVGWERQTR